MKLYLVRHGEAVPSLMDHQHVLSPAGELQIKYLAADLIKEQIKPAYIYHSGILRAEQTAQILAQNLQVTVVEKTRGLLPEDDIEFIRGQIGTWTEDTMLVGHLPYMAYLLEALCNTAYSIRFNTGTLVFLIREKNRWLVEAVF